MHFCCSQFYVIRSNFFSRRLLCYTSEVLSIFVVSICTCIPVGLAVEATINKRDVCDTVLF